MRIHLRRVLLWGVCISVAFLFFWSIQRIDFMFTKSIDVTPNFQRIWPDEGEDNDRILAQMNFIPQSLGKSRKLFQKYDVKTIFVYHLPPEGKEGIAFFIEQRCPVDSCELTTDIRMINQSDCVVFKNSISHIVYTRPENQIWVLYMLESPYNTGRFVHERDQVNWTATYRRDSTIVTPYEKFVLDDQSIRTMTQIRNYAKGKSKEVAWFVSNCGARNLRMEYAMELKKYISVDIFGYCGDLRCKRSDAKACFRLLDTDYKFYLSFENSNCRDYITEKFFVTGLQ